VSHSGSSVSPEQLVALLNSLLAEGKLRELEAASREALSQHKFFLWHMYLIVSLLRQGRKEEAAQELDDLLSYKFNLADRAWPEIKQAFPEKFSGQHVLSTMKPELGLETQARLSKHWDVPYPVEDITTFTNVVDELIAASVPAAPHLDRDGTRIATFGSCFAANLAQALKRSGLEATNLLIEESINSPLANREFLAAVAAGESARHYDRIREAFGEQFIGQAHARLHNADVLVITLGVAPAMFHTNSGEFAFLVDHKELLRKQLLVMRTPGVEELKEVLRAVIQLVRSINPGARLYFSISPVPLMGTIEMSHAVIADCISKSSLRAALHEALSTDRPRDVHYWSAFEIVRWLGAHTGLAVFGQDDRVSRHVSNWVVDLIVSRFARHLFGDENAPGATSSPAKGPWRRS